MIRVWHVDGVVYGPHLLQRSTTASGWHLLNSLHMKSPSTRLNWQISGGWVSCIPSEPLFWVPASLRNGLWSPYSTQVIGRHQATKLTYEHFVYGTDWAKCYVPPQSI
ncbi:hypothetical protein FB451DRAFT_1280571 [Mycena latifolia]|nr:hypothetical protein FB451DRAFT_1280571 [Mycena latifolia]